ncbi:hypothetical protein AB0I35_31275 [Nocardia sp. NPDC050378]|uniref:hypothetical protein n=1 Tax=Nocardia sp. NPDC050378 TaxID=3155400 RepID=UPI0033D20459
MTLTANDALSRYHLSISADPGGDGDLEINLVLTTRWLPRVGDTLNFDGPRGETLYVTVAQVVFTYRSGADDAGPEPEVEVHADVIENPVIRETARDLLDPVRLIEWAQAVHFVEAEPARQLVVEACTEVGLDEDHWRTITDWNDWAVEVRARRAQTHETA